MCAKRFLSVFVQIRLIMENTCFTVPSSRDNRESGVNPERTRRCKRGRRLSKPLCREYVHRNVFLDEHLRS